ncbi:MAG: META domain-containing protein [Anaerolineales bacterium]|nr:META domain-containing protein [Anaerolineales bacterium]
MKPFTVLTILLVFSLFLSTCAKSEPLPAGAWNLVSLNGDPLISGTQITIEFSDGQASGSSGCNSYGGKYEQDGNGIKFSDMASTLMACADSGMMAQESAYLAALQAVESYEVSADTLTLSGADVELVFSH